MIKYATAIRLGTASTEAILHPIHQERHPPRLQRDAQGRPCTAHDFFLARYLRDRDLPREINAGPNVVENYNGVNDYIHFGKSK